MSGMAPLSFLMVRDAAVYRRSEDETVTHGDEGGAVVWQEQAIQPRALRPVGALSMPGVERWIGAPPISENDAEISTDGCSSQAGQ